MLLRSFLQALQERGLKLPQNTGSDYKLRHLDCAVFRYLHQVREDENLPPFDTVSAFFVEGQEIYPSSGVRALDHVQICVRNPDVIRGFFFPR